LRVSRCDPRAAAKVGRLHNGSIRVELAPDGPEVTTAMLRRLLD
jgi:hypothetical protein